MASLAGFEPATRCLEGSRSIQLSYRDAHYGCGLKCSNAAYAGQAMNRIQGMCVVMR